MKRTILILLLIYRTGVFGQELPFEASDLTAASDLQRLQELQLHPLDPCNDDLTVLYEAGILDIIRWQALQKHLQQYGPLLSLYELQVVKGFDLSLIRRLLPYLRPCANTHVLLSNPKHQLSWRAAMPMEKALAYRDSSDKAYLGSGFQSGIRYRFDNGKGYKYAIRWEKDAGEPWLHFWDGGASLQVPLQRGKGYVIAGDYTFQSGQGLTLGLGGLFQGTLPGLVPVQLFNGPKLYSSFQEQFAFRGLSAVIRLGKRWSVIPLLSFRRLDVSNWNLDSLQQSGGMTIDKDGLHRNQKEINGRQRLAELLLGKVIRYEYGSWKAGFTAYYDHLRNQSHMGADWLYRYKNGLCFGELSSSNQGAMAFLAGLNTSLGSQLETGLLFRNYGRQYLNPYVSAYRNNSQANNERAYTWSLNWRPRPGFTWLLQMEQILFPWLKYLTDAPSRKQFLQQEIRYAPAKSWYLSYRLRCTRQEKNAQQQLYPADHLQYQQLWNNRVHLHATQTGWDLDARIEWTNWKAGTQKENGWMAYLDLLWKIPEWQSRFQTRFTLFHTTGYQSRIYTLEGALPGTFEAAMLQGKGLRFYALWNWKPAKHFQLSLRYGKSTYPDLKQIGSGWDRLPSNTKTEWAWAAAFVF